MNRLRLLGFSLVAFVVAVGAACSGDDGDATETPATQGTSTSTPTAEASANASATAATDLEAALPSLSEDIDALLSPFSTGFDADRIRRVGLAEDERLAWLVSDMLRFVDNSESLTALEEAFADLVGAERGEYRRWVEITNYLIANDIPAPDGYQAWKRELYLKFGEEWAPFFGDPDAEVDWRLVSWGGVAIDDRPIDPPNSACFVCIPALNDPGVTDADGGDWLFDESLVFGVEVNGETRAYPKHQMEVHEMVNDTLGGRRIAVVYCTLCGAAQAFFTDELPDGIETPTGTFELRTSGLLSRSNKVMYEFHTQSYFDTFLGRAVSGPLQDVGLVLEPISVSTATWGEWKLGHPDTSIVAEDGGIDREYPLDPLRNRDAFGPIFPIGDVDPRLPVQDQVLGVVHGDLVVAFSEVTARAALLAGRPVEFADVVVDLEAGALRARTSEGAPLTTHQAFWFAWSQFRPDTEVWGLE